MNTPKDPNASDSHQPVNEQRRRLAKGGLAAPIVIGTLLSRPVLGAAPHKCTISGQLSGNVSTHGTAVLCSSLGHAPSAYANEGSSFWPNAASDFLDAQNKPLLFNLAPKSQPNKFADAFQRKETNGSNVTYEDATVWDLLKGVPTNNNNGNPIPNAVLEVKSGMNTTAGLELGKEAIAAYMNAFDQTKYPITQQDVLAMFNSVIVAGGVYHYSSTVSWDASKVLAYFKSLHA